MAILNFCSDILKACDDCYSYFYSNKYIDDLDNRVEENQVPGTNYYFIF